MPFKYLDDLAAVWCEWAEMELQHKQFRRALDLMRRATAAPLNLDRRKVAARHQSPCTSTQSVTGRTWHVPVPAHKIPKIGA